MWLLYSLLSAVTKTSGALFRKVAVESVNDVVLTWSVRVAAIPIAIGLLLFDSTSQNLTASYWTSVLIAGLLASIAAVSVVRALKHSDLSYLAPYYTFVPVFTLLSAYIMLGETPSPLGILGVLLIVGGAYYLNSHKHQKILDPFKYLIRNKGAKLVLFATFLWSISTNLDKIATRDVSSQFLVASIMIIMSTLLTIPVLTSHRSDIVPTIRSHYKIIIAIALSTVLALLFQTLAIQTQLVGYALAFMRVDVLLTILAAGVFLKEKHILRRLEGAIPMVIGAVLILFA